MRNLRGRVAVVTGAGSGIGRALALKLASQGAELALADVSARGLQETKELLAGASARCYELDVSDSAAVCSFAQHVARDFGGVALLVNNAGVWKSSSLRSSTVQLMNEIVDTNLKGPFWVVHCALPQLKDGARLINISSVAGRIGVAGGRSLYAATKAAVDSLTRSWALELAPRGILVNAIAPGYVTTDMTA